MNNDNLKDFIQNNRDQFDHIENPKLDQVWNGINENNKPKSNKHIIWTISFLMLLGILSFIGYNFYLTTQKLNDLENYVMNAPEYKTEHSRLLKSVSEKEKEVENLHIDREEFEEIFEELKDLEEAQSLIEKDFIKYGNSRELMKTLFKHYERRTKILEILLFENEKKKNNENIHRHEM